MNLGSGLYLLPTYGRPRNLKRFFDRYHITRAVLPGVVILADEDPCIPDYYEVELPLGWSFYVQHKTEQEPVRCLGGSLRGWTAAHEGLVSKCEWIGLLTDDHFPVTESWDRKTVEALGGRSHIVSTNDEWMCPRRMTGAQAHSGGLIRALGWIFPPKLFHYYCDDVWESLGRALGIWTVKMDVIVKHFHHLNPSGGSGKDETYSYSEQFFERDRETAAAWMKDEFKDTCARLRALLNK